MTNAPVLLEFFNRPDKFKKVFDAVRSAKPKVLYLYQDGPRNQNDFKGVSECRKIASSVDWDCEVHEKFQDHNYGCDPSGYIAQQWFFSSVDFGIVLEDDCVPCDDFFYFCDTLLEKYKYDERIAFISGMNVLDSFYGKSKEDSYFFTAHGGIWGWASWKRVYNMCDPSYSWLNSKKRINEVKRDFYSRYEARLFVSNAKKCAKTGKPFFETLLYSAVRERHMLEIVPTVNLISNIGIGEGTHSSDELNDYPPQIRNLFYKKYGVLKKPLVHPTSVSRNKPYERNISPSLAKKINNVLYKIKWKFSKSKN